MIPSTIRSAPPFFLSLSAAILISTGIARAEDEARFDWGDAPDDVHSDYHYPTTEANHGASHQIRAGVFLGAGVDAEADGQPQIHAMGDDRDGDDEDGVVFISPVVAGSGVALEVTASVDGVLNAWIDFNRDGAWQHPAESVFENQPLKAGANSLEFTVPPGAQPGATYARFRFTTEKREYPQPDGPAPDGEVEDYAIELESAPVDHKMHWAQQPDPNGWDVLGSETVTLADDFRCTETGPINRIVFWGSWRGDEVGEISEVRFAIHSDDRTGEFGKPGKILWAWRVPGSGVSIGEARRGEQGWFDPSTGKFNENDHRQFFRHTVEIPAGHWFMQHRGSIYWLEIHVVGTGGGEWGWKTSRSAHFEADAVWEETAGKWAELSDPVTRESLDLAFLVASDERFDWGDAEDDPEDGGYPTLAANNGASHRIATNPQGVVYRLGATVDSEPDGQPDLFADGDDTNGSDDEDGVTFLQPLSKGGVAVVQVRASTAGYLNGWIDFRCDADWSDPGEHVFIDTPLAAGVNSFVVTVPANAISGYAGTRFRFTSQPFGESPDLDFRGRAPDGEVEDYVVEIQEHSNLDWGDAPDGPYPTGILENGARHLIDDPEFCLGNSIDSEPDGISDPNAAGDDGNQQDDEDGVHIYPLIPGKQGAMNITLGSSGYPGRIDAWIDFNGNGSWLDPGEKIANSVTVSQDGENPEPINIHFSVPADATPKITFARIRLSKNGGLSPTGLAPDGEVEDYRVAILPAGASAYDYGDAPFLTLDADNGARHQTGGGLHLGTGVDSEPDGLPDPLALGDDLDPPGGPSEDDGVEFPYPMIGGVENVVEINASAAGRICAWIDFNGDGDWGDPGEQILRSVRVDPGDNILSFMVPEIPALVSPNHFVRVRLSSQRNLAPTGPAPDGEVEDCMVDVYPDGEFDFGDAPEDPYPTRIERLGAAHMLDALFLGLKVDEDPYVWANPAASGDDDHGIDDEDGVFFDTEFIAGCTANVTIVSSGAGILDGWIDFDTDGTWIQSNEFAIPDLPVNPGPNMFAISVPEGSGPSFTYARFRLSHSGVGFDGYAEGGEVEDYRLAIGQRIESALSLDSLSSPTTLTLNWPALPGATRYSVYSSTTLLGDFPADWTLESSALSATTWTTPFAGPSKFFVIVAFP
jgi:hypothetical protein